MTSLMRGVHLVASSPIQYDDHSVSSAAGGLPAQQLQQRSSSAGQVPNMHELHGPTSPQQQQQAHLAGAHQGQPFPLAGLESPSAGQQADIQAYQPPWKSLIEYAAGSSALAGHGDTRQVNAASPRYQQLMGQVSERTSFSF